MIGQPATVLVLRALGLGDLCAAVPALRGLRRAFPRADLVLAAPVWQEPLARLAGVDRVVDVGPLEPLPPGVWRADLGVNLHGRGPQSTKLLHDARPDHLVAFAHDEVSESLVAPVPWQEGEHEVRRWCRLLQESGVDADPADILLPHPQPHGSTRPPGGQPRAVVHPGAAAAARRWPAQRFAVVAKALVDWGFDVVVTGTEAERCLCQLVASLAGGTPSVLAGRTTVMELAALVADADIVVVNDTGVAHLATAFATPSVVLFGPTPPSEWGPPAIGPHRALWAGARGDPHGEERHAGLAAIEVQDVIAAIEELLSGHLPSQPLIPPGTGGPSWNRHPAT